MSNPMRQLKLVAHGEPSDVIQLATTPEQTLGQEDVLVSMEAAPLNPSDFLFVRGIYGIRLIDLDLDCPREHEIIANRSLRLAA
jgi:NADPH:quinone reductase-like Zn-dependent oxidoreductase